MYKTKHLLIILACTCLMSMSLITQVQAALNVKIETVVGTIDFIHNKDHVLVVDDRSFAVSDTVVVKTASGRRGELSDLYPGRKVRLEITSNGDPNHPVLTIQRIYILR